MYLQYNTNVVSLKTRKGIEINMVGIAICTHSNFADGLKDACNMIMGSEQEGLVSLGFTNEDELLDFSSQLATLTETFTDGCIYVVDLVNASPFNAALLCIAHTDNVVLTGASLPMMLELLTLRNTITSPSVLAQMIVDNSCHYIEIKASKDVFDQ